MEAVVTVHHAGHLTSWLTNLTLRNISKCLETLFIWRHKVKACKSRCLLMSLSPVLSLPCHTSQTQERGFWCILAFTPLVLPMFVTWCTICPIRHYHFFSAKSIDKMVRLQHMGFLCLAPTKGKGWRFSLYLSQSFLGLPCTRRQTGPVWTICEKRAKTSNQQQCRLWVNALFVLYSRACDDNTMCISQVRTWVPLKGVYVQAMVKGWEKTAITVA